MGPPGDTDFVTRRSGAIFVAPPPDADVAVEQLSFSFDSSTVFAGSIHASLSSLREPSAVMNTSTVITTFSPAGRSPTHWTRLTGFSATEQAKFVPAPVNTDSGMSPT